MKSTKAGFPTPPEAWLTARRVANRMSAPIERFLSLETASGVLLLISAAAALVWANSPWSSSYHSLWHTKLAIGVGSWTMVQPLHFWINDFLMTVFFLVAGLEIKRELAEGELSELRRAALPVGAAIGGMLVPALIYFALNPSGPQRAGWGVPMATDIAFALGILALLGRRVPAAMRVLLLAIAIIDDLGAIIVIAVFYSSDLDPMGFAIAAAGLGVLIGFVWLGVRPGLAFALPMLILWAGMWRAGIHPTIAGVIVGLAAPVKPWLSRNQFLDVAEQSLADVRSARSDHDAHATQYPLRRLSVAGREAIAPVVRLETEFHPWVAFGIMPLFALANAGVSLGGVDFGGPATLVISGIVAGLVLGKIVGLVGAAWLMARLGIATLPRGVTWPGILVLGCFAGIGFTMSIFIAGLAFPNEPELLTTTKFGVLIATSAAAILGLAFGRAFLSPQAASAVADVTAEQAESSLVD